MSVLEDNINNIMLLRKMAWFCLFLQLWVAIFCLFCCLIFPQSYDLALVCGLLAISVSLIPFFFAFNYKNFSLVFSGISAFNIAPIWFLYLETVLPGHDAYTYILPAMRMEALFWVSVFLLFVNSVYIICWPGISRFSIKTFSLLNSLNLNSGFYQKATIICFISPLVAFYLFYNSLDTLWLAMTAGRTGGGSVGGLLIQEESLGNVGSLMLPVNSVWELTPLLGSIAYVSSTKRLNFFSILSFGLGLIVSFSFFLSGSRAHMMFVAAPIFFFFFYYNWDRGLKFWIIAIALMFVIIGVMELQVRFRGNLLDVIADPAQAAQERGLTSATTFDPTESHRDNNMYFLCLIIQGYPAKYPFQGLNDFFTILVNPIPRFIWPNKPVLLGAKDLSQQAAFVFDGPLFMGTTSLSYSIVGEAYQAGGALGLLFYALFYGIFLLFFDGVTYYAHRGRPMAVGVLGVGVFLAFWGFRALFALISFLYPIIILLLFLKLLQVFRSNANHVYSA